LEPPPVAFLARRKSYSWLVVGTVSIGSFMAQLDASIVQLLLPTMERQFGVGLSAASWVAVAYLLTLAACLPIFARLADMWGRKLLYVGGFLWFVLGSALCGLAPDLPALIGFRVVQAIGAALMASNSVATLVTVAGPERRGRAIGIQGAAQAIGLSMGPALGGLLLDTLGWRWVFWINVPVGMAGAVAAWFVLPQTRKMSRDRRFDWPGALLIAPALATVLMLLNEGSGQGPSSPAAISTALLASLFIILFFYTERREDPPLLDLRLLHKRALIAGILAGFLSNAALFGTFFLMTFVFVRGYHDTALRAGLVLTVIPVALSIVAPLSGALSDKLGARVLTFTGMMTCVAALALLFLGIDGTQSQPLLIVLALAVFGLGQGLFTAPNNSAVMGAAPEEFVGEAGGLLNVTRALGMSVGIAAASALLSWRLQALAAGVDTTLTAAAPDLIAAARGVILLLAGFAAAAGLLSLARTDRAGKQRPGASRERGARGSI
jgi:EmrB/QacA subfamily drug resistance transporter